MDDVGVQIEELAKLLAEEKRVEEKIHETQATLSVVKKGISESLMHCYVGGTGANLSMPEDLMKEEQSYERLLQALLDMKNDIVKRIRPVEEGIVLANADHLKEMFDHEKNKLDQCMSGIDQKILDCCQHISEYQRTRSYLNTQNERLSRLGVDPLPIPDPLPMTDLGDVITARIELLRSQERL